MLLTSAAFIAYISLIIYAINTKLKNRQLPLSGKVKLSLIAGPPIFMAIIIYGLSSMQPNHEAKYKEWTAKCGHEPVVGKEQGPGSTGLYYADYGPSAKFVSWSSAEYFCTFSEANTAGYKPDGNITKEILVEGGYTPTQAELNLLNRHRMPEDKIKF